MKIKNWLAGLAIVLASAVSGCKPSTPPVTPSPKSPIPAATAKKPDRLDEIVRTRIKSGYEATRITNTPEIIEDIIAAAGNRVFYSANDKIHYIENGKDYKIHDKQGIAVNSIIPSEDGESVFYQVNPENVPGRSYIGRLSIGKEGKVTDNLIIGYKKEDGWHHLIGVDGGKLVLKSDKGYKALSPDGKETTLPGLPDSIDQKYKETVERFRNMVNPSKDLGDRVRFSNYAKDYAIVRYGDKGDIYRVERK